MFCEGLLKSSRSQEIDWLFFDSKKFINYVGILPVRGEKLGGGKENQWRSAASRKSIMVRVRSGRKRA